MLRTYLTIIICILPTTLKAFNPSKPFQSKRISHHVHINLELAHSKSPTTTSLSSSTIDELEINVEKILKLRNVDASSNPRLISRGGLTLAKMWTLSDWKRHQATSRYFRHIVKWPISTTFRLISPVCLIFTLWSYLWIKHIMPNFFPSFLLPLSAVSLTSSAVALLLTLRTNQSLAR